MLNIFLNILERWTVRVATCPIFKLFGSEPVTNSLKEVIGSCQVTPFRADRDLSAPTLGLLAENDSLYPSRVGHVKFRVSSVALSGNNTNIAISIVILYPVYVVTVLFREIAIYIQNSKSVCLIKNPVKMQPYIPSAFVKATSLLSFADSVGGWVYPCKQTILGVVVQDVFKAGLSKHNILRRYIPRLRSVADNLGVVAFQSLNLATQALYCK